MEQEKVIDRINALPGMEEFKAFCGRLVQTANNMKALNIKSIPLPDLIFAADPGSGVTMHIQLLSELLKEQKLMQFIGEEEYFEWSLQNEQNSLNQFFIRVRRAAGFYGKFQGVIGLEIKALLSREKGHALLDKLMEYVTSQQEKILFVFVIPYQTPKKIQSQLIGRFASYSPVELISMPFPVNDALYYITDELSAKGFNVTEEAQQVLKSAIKSMSASHQFEGYQTLQTLTKEILWRRMSQQLPLDENITAADINFILEDNGYFSALKASSAAAENRKVGFGEEAQSLV